MISRSKVLGAAAACVNGGRDQQYGEPLIVFDHISRLWTAHLGIPITPAKVAQLMILMKVARAGANPAHADSWVDIAGYAACGAEVAGA